MHPGMKLDYMVKKGWQADWINIVKELVRKEWVTNYKPALRSAPVPVSGRRSAQATSLHRAPDGDAPTTGGTKGASEKVRRPYCSSLLHTRYSYFEHLQRMAAMFSSATGSASVKAAAASDPLEVYLASPPLPHVSDPLVYWDSISKAKGPDAALAQMALDFLSVPGKPSLT